ncbi:MAG: GNAT family N-acetyltransferase [Niabella sp.]
MIIREIETKDLNAVLGIYSPFINDTAVTFETIQPGFDLFKQRVASVTQQYPWLVAEEDGIILGYAYASSYRERKAYQWCCEVSIYLHPNSKGKGIAGNLYKALIEILHIQEFCNAYAVIALPNDNSVRFHEKYGFKWFATYNNVGYKLGKWHNVGWWQLAIQPPKENPSDPIPYRQIEKARIKTILAKYRM